MTDGETFSDPIKSTALHCTGFNRLNGKEDLVGNVMSSTGGQISRVSKFGVYKQIGKKWSFGDGVLHVLR